MTPSPFEQALGAEFVQLPEMLQRFHRNTGMREFSGRARVEHGNGLLPAIATKLGGFPKPTGDIPITISVRPDGETERWARRFGGHLTQSKLRYDKATATVFERFGLVTCALALSQANEILKVDVTQTKVAGIPLPPMFSPRSESREWQDTQGRFRFDIAAYLGRDRLLIRYAGWLTPAQ